MPWLNFRELPGFFSCVCISMTIVSCFLKWTLFYLFFTVALSISAKSLQHGCMWIYGLFREARKLCKKITIAPSLACTQTIIFSIFQRKVDLRRHKETQHTELRSLTGPARPNGGGAPAPGTASNASPAVTMPSTPLPLPAELAMATPSPHFNHAAAAAAAVLHRNPLLPMLPPSAMASAFPHPALHHHHQMAQQQLAEARQQSWM